MQLRMLPLYDVHTVRTYVRMCIFTLQSDDISRVSNALKIMERMVNQNTYTCTNPSYVHTHVRTYVRTSGLMIRF